MALISTQLLIKEDGTSFLEFLENFCELVLPSEKVNLLSFASCACLEIWSHRNQRFSHSREVPDPRQAAWKDGVAGVAVVWISRNTSQWCTNTSKFQFKLVLLLKQKPTPRFWLFNGLWITR
uniref:Uncharacterized protein n=1 Tax=Cannabis sativa TaxID=3483 RepID=A0A803P012_CANSA